MKYFTPELYLQFNSPDDAVADRAESDWEDAIREYNQYLKEHRGKMPANVRLLAEKCCFHDAVLLGWQVHGKNGTRGATQRRMVTIGLQQDNETIVLNYLLWNSPKETKRRKSWPFSQEQKHWLYDEVAQANGTKSEAFVHRVLWSDGSELEIPFIDVIVDRFPSLTPAPA